MLDSLFELRRDSRVPTRKTSNATFLVAALCIVIYQAKWSAALVMAFLAVSGVRVWNDQSPTIPNSSNLTVQCRGVLLSVLVKQGLPAAALRTATAWWSLSAFRESGRGIALLQGGRAREIMTESARPKMGES